MLTMLICSCVDVDMHFLLYVSMYFQMYNMVGRLGSLSLVIDHDLAEYEEQRSHACR